MAAIGAADPVRRELHDVAVRYRKSRPDTKDVILAKPASHPGRFTAR
jgi:hypothetical protein